MGIVSKKYLESIISKLNRKLQYNQWSLFKVEGLSIKVDTNLIWDILFF